MTEESAIKTPLEYAARYSAEAIRCLGECQGKYASFINKRLAADFAMPTRLADCKTPMELMEVWSDFYSSALTDYSNHANFIGEIGSEAVEGLVREAECEAEDIASATSKILKVGNGKAAPKPDGAGIESGAEAA